MPALDLDQEIGEDRQGLPTFDHVDDLRQRLQESFALQTETHVVLAPYALDLERVINQKLVVLVSPKSVEMRRNILNTICFSLPSTSVLPTVDCRGNLWIT